MMACFSMNEILCFRENCTVISQERENVCTNWHHLPSPHQLQLSIAASWWSILYCPCTCIIAAPLYILFPTSAGALHELLSKALRNLRISCNLLSLILQAYSRRQVQDIINLICPLLQYSMDQFMFAFAYIISFKESLHGREEHYWSLEESSS